MTLASRQVSDLSIFYDSNEFAVEIIYKPTGGFESTIKAIPVEAEVMPPYIRGEDTAVRQYRVRQSEVDNPQHKDQFEINDRDGVAEDWKLLIEGVEEIPGGEWLITVEREME